MLEVFNTSGDSFRAFMRYHVGSLGRFVVSDSGNKRLLINA